MKSTKRISEPRPLTADEQRQIDERIAARARVTTPEPIPGARTRYARWDFAPAALPEVSGDEQWLQIIDTTSAIEPFHVRVSEDADGRLIITGLQITGDVEITARVLREIQPAKIVQTLAWRETGSEPPRSVGDVDATTGLARFEGVAVEIEQTIADAQPVESKRGRPGPSDARLREIVDVYRRAARSTRYAIAETGRQMNLSRASVQRWLDLAHERELFPEGRVGAHTITREDD